MTTTASGVITVQEELLRDTLAACTAFQTWVGASTAAAAKQHIYLEALPLDLDWSDHMERERIKSRRPFALIWTAETDGLQVRSIASPHGATVSGTMYICLEGDVDPAVQEDYAEVDRLFKNTIGNIVMSGDVSNPGLNELAGTAGYRDFDTMTFKEWTRSHKDQRPTLGDVQWCVIEIRWGAS
jgi:hypothetical protein